MHTIEARRSFMKEATQRGNKWYPSSSCAKSGVCVCHTSGMISEIDIDSPVKQHSYAKAKQILHKCKIFLRCHHFFRLLMILVNPLATLAIWMWDDAYLCSMPYKSWLLWLVTSLISKSSHLLHPYPLIIDDSTLQPYHVS